MIGTLASVVRGEGWTSALRRAVERLSESARALSLRAAGLAGGDSKAPVLNVIASGSAPRFGGVQQQLASRLAREREMRSVALLTPGLLDLSRPHRRVRRVSNDLETGLREALALTGAKAVHFEGTHEVSPELLARLGESGIEIVLTVHDFALFCARPNLYEEPGRGFCSYSEDPVRCARCLRQSWEVSDDAQANRRAVARNVLASVRATIFPSRFLLDQHRRLFSLPALSGQIIPPAVETRGLTLARAARPTGVAIVGSVKPYKGGLLVPEIARSDANTPLHVFGGGDEGLLRAMRRTPGVLVHGYYRSGELPSLLVRHQIGLVVVPSVAPETFGLVISEAWQAGAAVVAFDLGAQGERIREQGGGWLVPLERGAAGIGEIIACWQRGELTTSIPTSIPSSADAAKAHIELYENLGLVERATPRSPRFESSASC